MNIRPASESGGRVGRGDEIDSEASSRCARKSIAVPVEKRGDHQGGVREHKVPAKERASGTKGAFLANSVSE